MSWNFFFLSYKKLGEDSFSSLSSLSLSFSFSYLLYSFLPRMQHEWKKEASRVNQFIALSSFLLPSSFFFPTLHHILPFLDPLFLVQLRHDCWDWIFLENLIPSFYTMVINQLRQGERMRMETKEFWIFTSLYSQWM